MAVQSLQYSSFLGGEVSPRLQYRTDMDKFGKWFKTAENIRFHTIGSFENRPGFAKVADTKRNIAGEIIKLISFSFNDEESFLLEFGQHRSIGDTGYLRVFKNGKPVLVDGVPYEIESPLKIEKESDIKYVQSGDIIFITDTKNPIYELRRLKKDGTEWEFEQFKFKDDCIPLDEENGDTNKILSITDYRQAGDKEIVYLFDFSDLKQDYFILSNTSLVITLDDGTTKNIFSGRTFYSYTELESALNSVIWSDFITGTVVTTKVNKSIQITYYGQENINNIKITAGYVPEGSTPKEPAYYENNTDDESRKRNCYYISLDNFCITNIELKRHGSLLNQVVIQSSININKNETYNFDENSQYELIRQKINEAEGNIFVGPHKDDTTHRRFFRYNYHDSKSGKDYYYDYDAIRITNSTRIGISAATLYRGYYRVKGYDAIKSVDFISYGNKISETGNSLYICNSINHNFFADKQPGDVFCIRKQLESHNYSGIQENGSIKYRGPLIGTGRWRVWTEGNWAGYFALEYSTDKGSTWSTFYEFHCNDVKKPRNPNISGELDGINGTCLIRAKVYQTSYDTYAMDMDLEHKGGDINIYYKVVNINGANEAVVECTKNDISEVYSSPYWREATFSQNKGYPQSLAFYQNRLFMSKDYQLYGSKTNDFWDFYEPTEVADDDPLNMSLLSYRVNNIKNITTIRSFFVFTQGGEFGISAEGALTQANKYLKQFSTHGSADCLPIVVGSAVIFVEKSANRVRALQYSFESDNYEAEDISVLLEELLEKETIITTEYLPNTHEILFLAESGIIWVLKFYPEQNIFSWSHWKHANGKITNICVVPHGSEDDLYIAIDTELGKQIEILSKEFYLDSKNEEEVLNDNKLLTKYKNKELYLYDKDNNFIEAKKTNEEGYLINEYSKLYCWWAGGIKRYFKSLNPSIGDDFYAEDEDGILYKVDGNITEIKDEHLQISIKEDSGLVATLLRGGETYDIDEAYAYFNYGLQYTSTATLLSPEITLQDGNNSVYHKKRPFKVHYVYKNSYGFKIGVEDNEKMEPEWQKVDEVIDNERELTSGKKAILVPARYDGTSRVSFVQDEPYPMIVENINIEVDYGGK